MSTTSSVSCGGGEQATSAVARRSFARASSARRTYGVVPEAAMPMTKSPARTPCCVEIFDRALERDPRRLPASA